MDFTCHYNPFFQFYWHSPTVYKKVSHESRTVHIIKKKAKTKPKFKNSQNTKEKSKRKFTYKKVLYNVGKTAQNCYKKVEELCEAAP